MISIEKLKSYRNDHQEAVDKVYKSFKEKKHRRLFIYGKLNVGWCRMFLYLLRISVKISNYYNASFISGIF